jgi:hypothetical protein
MCQSLILRVISIILPARIPFLVLCLPILRHKRFIHPQNSQNNHNMLVGIADAVSRTIEIHQGCGQIYSCSMTKLGFQSPVS